MKILLCLILVSAAASANVVFLESNALSTTNNSGHATVDLSGTLHSNPSWAPPVAGSDWISYGSTGDHSDPGYFSPADGTLVMFTTEFMLSGLITGANLTVLADDSTSVILNGHTLIVASQKAGTTCANHPVGCLMSTEGVFTYAELQPYLSDGMNELSFGVAQVNGSSFGVDFAGSVDTSATPEPATFGVIGGGLIALATIRRRKRSPRKASSGNLKVHARKFSPI